MKELKVLSQGQRDVVSSRTDTSVLGAELEARFMAMDVNAGRKPVSKVDIQRRIASLNAYMPAPVPIDLAVYAARVYGRCA